SRRYADVNDVLEISKDENSIKELKLEKFNLTACINDILKRYSKLKESDGYNLIFENTEDVFVNADNLKITQVIYNLINNALTYTGDDKVIKIRQSVIDDIVKIEIIDTGDGINLDEIDYIWDRYYKAKGNHKRAQIGTGLGLAIVKNILIMHNADFGVKNEENGGNRVFA
ncbi:MAG: HAMP domain-containing histidine kinase, partial [Akkermansia sp.]|nr:HAMP domain-containing histidine kinase [Akkermansia sp.]